MRTEDGRVVTAVSKEKEAAKREHEQAIQQGRMTGLVEHVTDDGMVTGFDRDGVLIDVCTVFTISLGCLPQLQIITTKLTVLMLPFMLTRTLSHGLFLVRYGPDGRRIHRPGTVPIAGRRRQSVRCHACRYDWSEDGTGRAHQDLDGRIHDGNDTKYQ